MSIWTRDELLSLIADWKAAEKAASTGKSYSIDGRSLTRQDILTINAQLNYYRRELASLSRGQSGPVIRRAVVLR